MGRHLVDERRPRAQIHTSGRPITHGVTGARGELGGCGWTTCRPIEGTPSPEGSLVSAVHQSWFLSGNLSAPHPRKFQSWPNPSLGLLPAPPFSRCHTSSTIKPKQPPEVPPKISYHPAQTSFYSHDPLSPFILSQLACFLSCGRLSPCLERPSLCS